MHVANFGVYASAERNLVFGINDFDEVHPAPWEWDLKRLAASAAVAARFMGGDKAEAADAARAIVQSYRKRMRRYAEMGYLEVWYDRIDEHDGPRRAVAQGAAQRRARPRQGTRQGPRAGARQADRAGRRRASHHRERAADRARDSQRGRHADQTGARPTARPYLDSLSDDRRRLLSRYRIVDVARKVVGVGSVGTGAG